MMDTMAATMTLNEVETPLLSAQGDEPPCSDATTTTNRIRGLVRLDSLRRIQRLLSKRTHCRRDKYKLLQSAEESRKLEVRRKKCQDRICQFLMQDDNNPKNDLDKQEDARSLEESVDTDSTSEDSQSAQDQLEHDFFEVSLWDEEEALISEDRVAAVCGYQLGIESEDSATSALEDDNSHDSSAELQEQEPQRLDETLPKARHRRPTLRLNLARKGNAKFVEDRNELREWHAAVRKMRKHKRAIACHKGTIHTLRVNSKLLEKPIRRGFEDFEEATGDRIMFSIIHEAEDVEC